jgi:hypothetical protein
MFEEEVFIKCFLNDGYSVSNLGRLRNDKNNKILEGSTTRNKSGYLYFKINNKYYTSQRLIYKSFNINDDIDNLDIDHIDRNKLNNRLDNLRKCSRSDNLMNQGTRLKNQLNEKYIYKLKEFFIFEIRTKNLKDYQRFNTLEACKEYKQEFYNNNKDNYPFLCI